MADIFSDPATYNVGPEFRLFVRLVLVEQGFMEGAYNEIAGRVSSEARNIRSWITKLEQRGLITIECNRRQSTRIKLREPYLAACSFSCTPMIPEKVEEPDPELESIILAYKTAKQTGATIRVSTQLDIVGNGKPTPKV